LWLFTFAPSRSSISTLPTSPDAAALANPSAIVVFLSKRALYAQYAQCAPNRPNAVRAPPRAAGESGAMFDKRFALRPACRSIILLPVASVNECIWLRKCERKTLITAATRGRIAYDHVRIALRRDIAGMMRSHFEQLRRRKAFVEQRDLPIRTIAEETGLSQGAILRVKNLKMERVYLSTLERLCRYFAVGSLSELIEYVDADTDANSDLP
jgi:DNA-binding Xre family transcriptional regulator